MKQQQTVTRPLRQVQYTQTFRFAPELRLGRGDYQLHALATRTRPSGTKEVGVYPVERNGPTQWLDWNTEVEVLL